MKIKMSSSLMHAFFAVAIVVLGVSGAWALPPVNDSFNSPVTLTGLPTSVTGSNNGATPESCEPTHVFPEHNFSTPKSSVWYKWQAPATGSYTIRRVNSDFDLTISAYTFGQGNCSGNMVNMPFRKIEGRSYNANLGFDEGARITFRAVQNETIYISVDSLTGPTGSFGFVLEKTKYNYSVQLDYSNGAADLAVNDTNTNWWISRHFTLADPTLYEVYGWGVAGDRLFMADFNGDAISDFASVRRENGVLTWWVKNRLGAILKIVQFGLINDRAIVGDWDGDGIADIAVTRPDGTGKKLWHVLRSSDGQYQVVQYGLENDKEMVGDYDGDGKTDFVVLRLGAQNIYKWYIRLSATGTDISREFGQSPTDYPQAADFDGDGKTDITMFRGGTWYSLDSSSPIPLEQRPTRIVQFGSVTDRPQAADYDGDRKSDYAIYRDGEWWILRSRDGQTRTYRFGANFHIAMSDGGIQHAFITN